VVNFDVVLNWMGYIRDNPDNAHRFSEAFWQSQIDSKKWLLEHVTPADKSIVIFGGWFGVLAHFIAHKYPESKIITTDIDPECQKAFYGKYDYHNGVRFQLHDMQNGMPTQNQYPDLVINTSCEHVTQEVYDAWWESIPTGTKYIVQGNNLFIPEHIRAMNSLENFLEVCHVDNPQYAGMLQCGQFYRYMAVGYK
jgi:hypothetical protein